MDRIGGQDLLAVEGSFCQQHLHPACHIPRGGSDATRWTEHYGVSPGDWLEQRRLRRSRG